MAFSPAKIGVLTFHRCINYGSYWQARCLVEGLRARGLDAVLLDHDSPRANRAEWRCAFQPTLPRRTARADFPRYAAKTRKFLAAFDRLPRSRRFRVDRPDELDRHDLIVVGSDEVWNLRHPWYGGEPIFWGAGLPAERLVSYAASFGNHDAADGLGSDWAERLRRFDSISVRDENSRRLVRGALAHEPALSLDPCLQFPPAAPPAKGEAPLQPYAAVYGHSFPRWFAEAIRSWARGRGLRLVSIGYRNDWADAQHIEAGPDEFAQLIAGAAAVATNFFHGCVFSLVNDKPFTCASSPYRSNKVRDLTRALGAGRRLVHEESGGAIAALMDAPLDPAVGQRIAALRSESARYLDHALA